MQPEVSQIQPFGNLLSGTLAPDQMAMMARDAGLADLPARLRRVLDESRVVQEYAGKIKGADVKPHYVRQAAPNDGTRAGQPMTAEEAAALNPPPQPEWIIVDPVSLEEMKAKILAGVEKKLKAEGWTPRGAVTARWSRSARPLARAICIFSCLPAFRHSKSGLTSPVSLTGDSAPAATLAPMVCGLRLEPLYVNE